MLVCHVNYFPFGQNVKTNTTMQRILCRISEFPAVRCVGRIPHVERPFVDYIFSMPYRFNITYNSSTVRLHSVVSSSFDALNDAFKLR